MELIARGRIKSPRMNRLEERYSLQLNLRLRAGEVAWYRFEGITLKLGDDCRYTPDFAVMLTDGEMEMHETKGFFRDDALVKIKSAAVQFPFRFYVVRWEHGGFSVQKVG